MRSVIASEAKQSSQTYEANVVEIMIMIEERIASEYPVLHPGDFRREDGTIDNDAWVRYASYVEKPEARVIRLSRVRRPHLSHEGKTALDRTVF